MIPYVVAVNEILAEFRKNSKDMSGSAVITAEGLPIATDLPRGVDVDTFAIMAGTMFGAAATMNSELKSKVPERVTSVSGKGEVMVFHVNAKSLFVVAGTAESQTLVVDAERALKKLREVLK